MVQIAVKIPNREGKCTEWAMIELQGELETRHPVPSVENSSDVPVLIIGHHILYGKVVQLEKPFAVLAKDTRQDNHMEVDHSEKASDRQTEYHVNAIIKKKILFKTRPKPIIANVPKKL